VDHEFLESVLVPQVMLYGFLGFQPTVDGFRLDPKLPRAWPSLSITGIHIHDWVLDVTAQQNGNVQIKVVACGTGPLRAQLPAEHVWLPARSTGTVVEVAP
jgi:hypothetical protein